MIEKLTFKQWLSELAGATGAIYDPKATGIEGNWEGAPGSTGVSIKGDPIKSWTKKKKSKKK